MSNNFKISTKGLVFYAPLTDKYLQTSVLASDVSTKHNHATVDHGSATYSATGYECDGSTDYLTFPALNVFNSTEITIALRFTPNVAYDADVTITLFDTSNLSRYLIIKQANAFSNRLDVWLGNTKIQEIAEGVYSPYWLVGQENTIIVTGDDTGDLTNVWLNGNQILVNDGTSWSNANPASMFVGAAFNGSGNFDGKLRDFMVFNRILAADERAAFDASSRGVYAPSKQSTLHKGLVFHAPLTDKYLQDDAGLLASDVSMKHNHANAVTGTPTYSSSGIDFNDVTTKLDFPFAGVANVSAITLAFRFTPDFVANDGDYHYFYDSVSPRTYILKYNSSQSNQMRIALYNTTIVDIPFTTYGTHWRTNEENVIVITADDSSNLTNVWLNGVQVVTNEGTVFSNGDVSTFSLGGKNSDGSTPFDGEIRDFRVWNRILTSGERVEYESASGPVNLKTGN